MSYDICVVIVSYNSEEYLAKSIESAIEFIGKQSSIKSVITVVDNNSTDGSKEIIKHFQNDIKFYFLKKNIGFGAANNVAMRDVEAKQYFLLNSDAWLENNDIIKAYQKINTDHSIGVVGFPLVFPNKSAQTYTYSYSSPKKMILQILKIGYILKWILRFRVVQRMFDLNGSLKILVKSHCGSANDLSLTDVSWVCGAAMMISKRLLEETNGFDEKIFLYGEDEDLCIQAKQKKMSVKVCYITPIVHVFGWGKNKFNPVVAKLKYDSLKYFYVKNSKTKIQEYMAKLLLPWYVFGIKAFYVFKK